ncbi:hypothetical protein B0T25DRAFT_447448 [Lasiosphaeria hispida]|uniref:SET domain-containing protein n=1 Tax=Lasiosphaeria hispida TaxID=260671 RepID=A0AAJ0MIR6_9PEZI|nr:hypothetical protein B0T25DRAFT_447448 [Lasiosphaeria hispida]
MIFLLAALSIAFLPLSSALAPPTQCQWDTLNFFCGGFCSPTIDDNTISADILSSIPWTHQPFCVDALSNTEARKLCVYSVDTFNENTGFSLIATPGTAAHLVSTGAVHHGPATWRSRHFINYGGRPASDNTDLAYKINQVVGKGIGVVATRLIKTSDVFMVSFPAMIVDNSLIPSLFNEGSSPTAEGPRLFQRALDQLTDRERLTSLAKSWGAKNLHVVDDVIRTNAFGLEIDGRGHKGLFPEIARMNHGCDPKKAHLPLISASIRYDERTLGMIARATRDIKPGEEIQISYIPLGLPQASRARALRNWGFECTCSLCTAPPADREASDSRRARLGEIRRTFGAMTAGEVRLTYNEFRALSHEIVSIAERERLTTMMVEINQELTRMWYQAGVYDEAVRYARTAVKSAKAYSDTRTEFFQGLRRNLIILEGLAAEA